jgi:hypothetical protein
LWASWRYLVIGTHGLITTRGFGLFGQGVNLLAGLS